VEGSGSGRPVAPGGVVAGRRPGGPGRL